MSKSSFYNYLKNKDVVIAKRLATKQENESLMEKFKEIISSLGHVPGKRTFKTHMWRRFGINLSIKKCKKIMCLMHLVPTLPKKDAYKGQATHFHECACAFNYVNQDFKIGPRRVILTDITYLYYGLNRSRCYLCIFKDAFTNEILGHSVSLHMDVSLVKEAYDLMMDNHSNEIKTNKVSVYIHSDQGSQYLSTDFKTLLSDNDFIQSNSFRGNSQDNAPCESTFARLKTEITDIIARCPNVSLVKELIDGYIDTYNNQRYQLPLAGLSPHEFYLYSITGIYPLDNYFGVKASRLLSIEDIVKANLDELKRLSDRRKELSNKRRLESSKIKDPEKILLRDQKVLNKEISKWMDISLQAKDQLVFLKGLYDKNSKAITYYGDLSKEEKEQFKDPLKWRDTPEMSYVMKMADLF